MSLILTLDLERYRLFWANIQRLCVSFESLHFQNVYAGMSQIQNHGQEMAVDNQEIGRSFFVFFAKPVGTLKHYGYKDLFSFCHILHNVE